MTQPADELDGPKLHRVLGLRDLVLLNIAVVVGLRWLSTAAQLGPASLVLWALGLVLFFIPLGMAVVELSSRMPGEGGLYLWAKSAFGDAHGFVAGWTYWISNLVFFPSMLLFGAGVFAYVAGDRWLPLAESASFNGAYCLCALWGATLLNYATLFSASLRGPIDSPSPITSSVMPCFTSDSARPSTSSESVAHESMLMNPGATALP